MSLTTKICHSRFKRLCLFLLACGPGITVMLADADAGSLITAAQSGAVWGYKLLIFQIILIPILYVTQELTLRLGLVTGKGHSELIKNHFGKFWAWFSVITLVISCVGALVSELGGIAAAGSIFGIPNHVSVLITIAFLLILVLTRSYNSVERIAVAIGSFELIYLFVAWQAHPSLAEIKHGFSHLPLGNSSYLYLVSANIGAVIMPWMIFYQQSAVIDKKLKVEHLHAARIDTAIGAVITQLVMSAVIIAVAATIGKTNPGVSLENVQDISHSITPFLGHTIGEILFALGMIGASLIATIVVLLAAAWSIGEITGCKHSLQDNPREAPWFYSVFAATLAIGGILVSSNVSLIRLNIAIEVMNAFILPITLGFLFLLAIKLLPKPYKLSKWYAVLVGIILGTTSIIGVAFGLWGIFV